MGRWLVILTLAMAQCPDAVAAEPQSPGIPLPKPRPVRHPPAPAAKAAEIPAAESAAEAPSGPASPSQEPDLALELRDSIIDDPAPRTGAEAPQRSGSGECTGGKRIISAYYWQGKRTASGQLFDPQGMTAAHRTLPFGTHLTVSNPRTGKSVTVVVNDRGPFVSGVSLDLSLGAAQALGMHGTGAVCIE